MPRRALPSCGDGNPAHSSLASAPRTLPEEGDRYRLQERIGGGGTAEVWRAVDLAAQRTVALKRLHPALAEHPRGDAVLEHEAAVLAALRHPHIVGSEGLVLAGGRPALVLEYLGGGDLVALAGCPVPQWLRPAREILAALTYLHSRGYVHRDLKARNVLFDANDRARLIDFASVVTIGSPRPKGGTTGAYRPGLAENGPATPDDDAVAFAVLLHELITGRLPARSPIETGAPRRWRSREPLAALREVVRGTLYPKAGERRRGLSAFADVIESATAAAE